MSGITPYAMLNKLEHFFSHNQSQVTYSELKKIYYLEKMSPQISSKSTFVEKIQDLIDFGFLEIVPIKTRNTVYRVNWDNIDIYLYKEREE